MIWSPRRRRALYPAYRRLLSPLVNRLFYIHLIDRTGNFNQVRWRGRRVWQNPLDLWTIQETIWELRPELIIECGTYEGGGAFFYADLLSLFGQGRVLSIDVERLCEDEHPRVEFVVGSSTSAAVVERAAEAAKACSGPVMVILDSDHSRDHVRKEMELYGPLVTPGSYMMVQDGVIDVLPTMQGPGPLAAVREFLPTHPEFEVDTERSSRFLVTHSPCGWLRKRAA